MSDHNVVTVYIQFVINVAGVYIQSYPFYAVAAAFLCGSICAWKVTK